MTTCTYYNAYQELQNGKITSPCVVLVQSVKLTAHKNNKLNVNIFILCQQMAI